MNKNYMNKPSREQSVDIVLNMVNVVPDFIEHWHTIDETYKQLGWTDRLRDDEKIKEYQDVNNCYKKYVTGKRAEVLDNIDNPQVLLNKIQYWKNTATQKPRTGWTRVFITYNILKDAWLLNLSRFVSNMISKEE